VPAAAVTLAPRVYVRIVALETLVVDAAVDRRVPVPLSRPVAVARRSLSRSDRDVESHAYGVARGEIR